MGLTVGELNILLEGEVDDFVRETRRARNELDRFANQAEDRTTAANRGFDVLALGVFGVVTAITALGAAIATIGLGRLSIDAVAAEASFGRLLGQIQTLVGVSVEELAELRQGVLDISRETGRGPEELADALFAVTSAGQRGAEALETQTHNASAEIRARSSILFLFNVVPVSGALLGRSLSVQEGSAISLAARPPGCKDNAVA